VSTTTSPRKGARDRLVEAAERLFVDDGIRAVGVDRLCAEAGVSKRSLYTHFAGKDEVVVAMLEARAHDIGARLAGTGGSPREEVLAVFEANDALAVAGDYRGCPFVAAATELKDREHPAARTALAAKAALTRRFETLAREGGARDPEQLATALTLVFDGASAHAVVRGESTPVVRQTVELLLDAHGL